MSLDVSSWFIDQLRQERASPQRIFTINGCDFSHLVLRWPKVKYKADTIDLGRVSIDLSNRNREFQFFVDSGLSMTASCEIALSFTHPELGPERASLYLGEPSGVRFSEGGVEARLQLQGKTKRLTDVSLGTDTDSGGLDFTDSDYFPSDLAWTLVTCFGGLSAVQDSSNPDIDYPKWKAWNDVNIVRDVRVNGFFTGEKIYQVLNTLAFMDSVMILFRNTRLDFTPIIDGFGAGGELVSPDEIIDLNLSVDPTAIVNDFSIEISYDIATRKFQSQLSLVNSQSILDFGRRSGRFGSQSIWFADLDDARYFAEDIVRFHQKPAPRISLKTPLAGGAHLTVGDVVTVTDSLFQQERQSFRITELGIDLGRGRVDFRCERANQRPWHFQSTVSSKNFQVRTISAVGSGRFLGIDQIELGKQVYRTDGDGVFQPLDLFASALMPISQNEILFGGPPSSGWPHSVLQRSSDGGLSSAIVSSLTPFLPVVHDIFEVKSGTHLASTSSGGIWRSSDAGSSWSITMPISGAYHVRRFFRPYSGSVWGGTGFDNPSIANGAHIWESLDDGISWVLRHTVIASGDLHVQGFFRISDTEFLLSTAGPDINDLGVFRSEFTSADSISWHPVLPQVGFTEIVRTSSSHLLLGFHEDFTFRGGSTYRSFDNGSSWIEDARISKRGNIKLVENEDGTVEAFTARIVAGVRTDRHRNFDPNRSD